MEKYDLVEEGFERVACDADATIGHADRDTGDHAQRQHRMERGGTEHRLPG